MASDPSQMSFKQIHAMLVNPATLEVSNAITTANKDMVTETKNFERVLKYLETTNAQVKQ